MIRYTCLVNFLVIILLAGCSPERNLAREYLNTHTGNGIMIVPSYELFKDNLSVGYNPDIKYSPGQLDSIAWAQSCFIRQTSDSVFLTRFTNSMINELIHEGFDVYVDGSSDVFLSLPDPKWVVQIAQLQLNEEHVYNYYEMYSVATGEPETHRVRINQVKLESWLETSRANANNKKVLYLQGYIQDVIKRGINVSLSEASLGMEQNRDSIRMSDVYIMADQLGQKHAELLFDYFMNDYIREKLQVGDAKLRYFYFDRRSKKLKQGSNERFEVVK